MFSNYKFYRHSVASLAILLLSLVSFAGYAEPYLALRNNLPCAACHINPIGGGARTSYGTYYGAQVLPEQGGNSLLDLGNPSDNLRLGVDFRENYDRITSTKGQDSNSFEVHSGQVYLALTPRDSRFTLYVDEQLTPGAALNREAFILTRFNSTVYLKAGTMILPYGLRLEDDSAFIRQASGVNFHSSDNGVELGLQYEHGLINLALSNGSNTASNNDKRFQYLLRAEYLGDNWRLGSSAAVNDSAAGARTMYNLFGGVNALGCNFLAEVDYIQDKSLSYLPGTYNLQQVRLVEVNRELSKGYNLKLTAEYLDPDTHIAENQRTRTSLLLEYTPFANLQVRTGVRIGKDIPQRLAGNYSDVFVQLHFYY